MKDFEEIDLSGLDDFNMDEFEPIEDLNDEIPDVEGIDELPETDFSYEDDVPVMINEDYYNKPKVIDETLDTETVVDDLAEEELATMEDDGKTDSYTDIDLDEYKDEYVGEDGFVESATVEEKQKGGKKNFIILGVLLLVMLALLGFLGMRTMTNKRLAAEQAALLEQQTILMENISPAKEANEILSQMNIDFKTAITIYRQDNNRTKYQETLAGINNLRNETVELLESTEGEETLTNLVKEHYDKLLTTFNDAYSVTNPTDGAKVFNQWNEEQFQYNNRYIKTLVDLLNEHNIPYELEENEQGSKIIYGSSLNDTSTN